MIVVARGPLDCACGCGLAAPLAKRTRRRLGHVKGRPTTWVRGHQHYRTVAERFWEKVEKQPGDGCWIWVGATTKGYGLIKVAGRMTRAHRLAYELLVGQIPPEKPHVLHNCPGGDNPSCVNPAHLFVDTHKRNMEDMVAKGRHRHGDLRGEASGSARMTEAQVLEIRRLHAEEGLSERRLALRFMVHPTTVHLLLTGETWKHLLLKAG